MKECQLDKFLLPLIAIEKLRVPGFAQQAFECELQSCEQLRHADAEGRKCGRTRFTPRHCRTRACRRFVCMRACMRSRPACARVCVYVRATYDIREVLTVTGLRFWWSLLYTGIPYRTLQTPLFLSLRPPLSYLLTAARRLYLHLFAAIPI